MSTYLLTWNPGKKGADGDDWLEKVVKHLGHAKSKRDQWSTGTSKSVSVGDRLFLLRQGHDRPGIIGSGKVTKGWFEGDHWNLRKIALRKANYIRVVWDTMVLPQSVLPRERLLRGVMSESLVNAQSSGREIETKIAARLEKIWSDHLKAVYSNASYNSRAPKSDHPLDDTYDDLDGSDSSEYGSDGAPEGKHLVSGVRRDPRVRRTVIKRSKRICEQPGCRATRNFAGFIDVHHILGAAKSDRVWNCVALCPNCHREAHYAPNRDEINALLLKFARSFRVYA